MNLVIGTLLILTSFASYLFVQKLKFWFYEKKNHQHEAQFPGASKAQRCIPLVPIWEQFLLLSVLFACLGLMGFVVMTTFESKEIAPLFVIPVMVMLLSFLSWMIQDLGVANKVLRRQKKLELPILSFLSFDVRSTTTLRLFVKDQEKLLYVDCAYQNWRGRYPSDQLSKMRVSLYKHQHHYAHKAKAAASISQFEECLKKKIPPNSR